MKEGLIVEVEVLATESELILLGSTVVGANGVGCSRVAATVRICCYCWLRKRSCYRRYLLLPELLLLGNQIVSEPYRVRSSQGLRSTLLYDFIHIRSTTSNTRM
ncbi:unnamed protein product [Linum tenue]|uniref:Uncharacterized protein n=1 Tax=Linum tenue TaxID=586396 RepID=A0AAV0QQ61_9ROSI|nr:unnamed protein product [Linum tenue]